MSRSLCICINHRNARHSLWATPKQAISLACATPRGGYHQPCPPKHRVVYISLTSPCPVRTPLHSAYYPPELRAFRYQRWKHLITRGLPLWSTRPEWLTTRHTDSTCIMLERIPSQVCVYWYNHACIRYILIFCIESSRCFPSRKVDHTLHFIDLVREAFARNPAAYNDFFHTLKLYESNA